MNASMTLPVPSAVGSLEGYIQSVNRFPLLTQEEEYALATRFKTKTIWMQRANWCSRTCAWSSASRAAMPVTACRRPT